jgi:hypothetical protein
MLTEEQKDLLIKKEKYLRAKYPLDTLGDEEQGRKEIADIEAMTKATHDNPIVKEFFLAVMKSQEELWRILNK